MTKSFQLTDTLFDQMIGEQVAANRFMETGNLAEFGGKADPASFTEAFKHLENSLNAADKALAGYDELIATLEKSPTLPIFSQTVKKLLREAGQFERISNRRGARYSDIGVTSKEGKGKPEPRLTDLVGVMKAQREDLRTLRRLTAETLEAFKGVLPVTEKGAFVRTMLSGRSPFSEKYEELVDARFTFAQFYARGCMVSIQAVMQNYPAGFEFLQKGN